MNNRFFPCPSVRICLALCLVIPITQSGAQAPAPKPKAGFSTFITRQGDALFEGNKEYRFISVNIPNFHILEDPGSVTGTPWHRVTEFEQRDAVKTVAMLGGRAFRIYTFSVAGGRNNPPALSHITGIDPATDKPALHEDLFRDLDRGLALAREYGVRVIIPLMDNWEWFGGDRQWAALRGKEEGEFYTDPQCQSDFEYFIAWLLNRKNTVTGEPYKNDKTVLCWELGNELENAPDAWITKMAAFLKQTDPNHLVMDGQHKGPNLRKICLNDPNIDIVTYHYGSYLERLRKQSRGKKPFLLGEYFGSVKETGKLLDKVIDTGISGAMIWSLRFRSETGGFYYHDDFDGRSDSLQFPGFEGGKPDGERELFRLLREKAYAIRGLPVPPLPRPDAPRLLPGGVPGGLSWQGSVGADDYELQRALSARGPWQTIGSDLREDGKAAAPDGKTAPLLPLFTDNDAPSGRVLYYRLLAKNASGLSAWSEVVKVSAR